MEIPVRAKVKCADGPGGEATHVIVHPSTKRVTRLVVKDAKSPQVERIVPFRFVEGTTAGEIRLRCSQQEMSKMPAFVRKEVVKPSPEEQQLPVEVKMVKRLNIAEDELVMDTDTRVKVTDGKAGHVGELMVDPANGSITHLTLYKGPLWAPKQVTVPISEVGRIGDRVVYLNMDRAGMEALPATAGRRR